MKTGELKQHLSRMFAFIIAARSNYKPRGFHFKVQNDQNIPGFKSSAV